MSFGQLLFMNSVSTASLGTKIKKQEAKFKKGAKLDNLRFFVIIFFPRNLPNYLAPSQCIGQINSIFQNFRIICCIKNLWPRKKSCPAHIFFFVKWRIHIFCRRLFQFSSTGQTSARKFVIILIHCRMESFITLHTSSAFCYHLVCISSKLPYAFKMKVCVLCPRRKNQQFLASVTQHKPPIGHYDYTVQRVLKHPQSQ